MIARLPSAMLPLAILLLVDARIGSLAAAGLVVGAFSVGRAAVSPGVGALVDRLGQVRVLIAGAVAQVILLGGLVLTVQLGASLPITTVVGAVAGAASPPIQACLRALWPLVAPGDAARDAAYSFDATSQELIWIVGPLLVSALLIVISPAMLVIVCAAIGSGGIALFVQAPVARRWKGSRNLKRSRLGALASEDLRTLLVTVMFTGLSWGALTFGLVALAVSLGNSRASGLLLALVSAAASREAFSSAPADGLGRRSSATAPCSRRRSCAACRCWSHTRSLLQRRSACSQDSRSPPSTRLSTS
jgi:MFS family permease